MEKRDSLGRRWRFDLASTGKRVTPGERELVWFEMNHRHGPLTTDALHEFTKHTHRSRKNSSYRLRDLSAEKDTPHGGPYIERPWQQVGTLKPERHLLVHDNSKFADLALQEAELYREHSATTNAGHWKHDFMLSSITSSIHLACLERPDEYEYIFHDQILERILAFEFPISYSYGKDKKAEKVLKPDRAFGIRYKKTGNVRIYLIEADGGTERNRSESYNVKSHQHNIHMYHEFVGKGGYKKYFGANTRLMVINIFSVHQKMLNVIDLATELSDGKGYNWLLYQSWPIFGRFFVPPKPRLDLFTAPYFRAGNEPFNISEA